MDVISIGGGPVTVVALHGIQGTAAAWRTVADMLAARARFVLPNLRGRGAAARGQGPADHTLAAHARDVAAVVERQVAHGPFVLAGWSLGVSVALELVQSGLGRRPDALALLSGTPCIADVRWFAGEGEELMTEIAARERRLRLTEAADHEAVAWTWQAVRGSDQRPLLSGIDQPTLVLHGRDDADCPWPQAGRLADGLPRARLVTIEGAGHGLLAEAAPRIADELGRFLDELNLGDVHAPRAGSNAAAASPAATAIPVKAIRVGSTA